MWNPVKELKDDLSSHILPCPRFPWNPVKELKARIAHHRYYSENIVESGEGIERHRHHEDSETALEVWNPVKELKGT